MFERAYIQQLTAKLKDTRKFIQVLMAPRQVGKNHIKPFSFWKRSIFRASVLSADAIVPANGEIWLEQQWQAARLQWKNAGSSDFLLVIDEIQKINNWSEVVKKLWGEDTRGRQSIKVLLLGSSRFQVRNTALMTAQHTGSLQEIQQKPDVWGRWGGGGSRGSPGEPSAQRRVCCLLLAATE